MKSLRAPVEMTDFGNAPVGELLFAYVLKPPPRPAVTISGNWLCSLELQDVETGVVVGQVHHALRVDKAVGGLDDFRPVGARVEHAFRIGRHEEPGLARLERIFDVKHPHTGIVVGREDEARVWKAPGRFSHRLCGPKLPPLAQ